MKTSTNAAALAAVSAPVLARTGWQVLSAEVSPRNGGLYLVGINHDAGGEMFYWHCTECVKDKRFDFKGARVARGVLPTYERLTRLAGGRPPGPLLERGRGPSGVRHPMTDDKIQAAIAHHAAQRTARADELRARAASKRAEAMATNARAHEMGDRMGGEPIKIGHHSETRHRRDMGRMDGLMGRFVRATDEADALEAKAASVETRDRIESDNPDALTLLRAKLTEAETEQAAVKAKVAAVRKGLKGATTYEDKARAYLVAGFSAQATATHLSMGGVPAYLVTNAGAKVRGIKARIAEVAAQPSRCPSCGGTLFERSGDGCNDPECRH